MEHFVQGYSSTTATVCTAMVTVEKAFRGIQVLRICWITTSVLLLKATKCDRSIGEALHRRRSLHSNIGPQ